MRFIAMLLVKQAWSSTKSRMTHDRNRRLSSLSITSVPGEPLRFTKLSLKFRVVMFVVLAEWGSI